MANKKDWQSFALVSPVYPVTDVKWTSTTVNALNLVIESGIGDEDMKDTVEPNGDGASTDFTDYTNGGTATYSDFALNPFGWFFRQWLAGFSALLDEHTGEDLPNGATGSVGDAQSWTYASPRTDWTAITSISVVIYLIRTGTSPRSQVELFFRPTSGSTANEQTIQSTRWANSTDTLYDDLDLDGYYHFIGYSETNPYTSAAWTVANITAGEFGIRVVGGEDITIGAVDLIVRGTASSSTLFLDSLQVDVVGGDADESADTGIIGKTRLWSTDKAHLRMTAPGDVDDVTNSVAVTTPGTLPLDWDIFYGQVYLVNGTDKTRRYPNDSDVYEALTNNGANYITGRSVAAFANRILYSWVNDNGTITPERVAYSKFNDGGDHDDASAGDFDVLDTPGGVTKLATLSEDVCAAYKGEGGRGIYCLRRTGNAAAPIIVDLIDRETSLVAPATVQTLVDANGTPFQMFLGRNRSNGLNVYYYDCTRVSPVWGIHKWLREEANPNAITRAFAGVEPQEGHYCLFVAQGTDELPKHYFTYHVRSGQWTGPHTLDEYVSAAGIWTLNFDYETGTTGTPGGTEFLVVGSGVGAPKFFDYKSTHDEIHPYSADASIGADTAYTPEDIETNTQGLVSSQFTSIIETGDYRLSNDDSPEFQATLYRIHVMYKDEGPLNTLISISTDGGVSYGTERFYQLGGPDPDKWGQYLYEVLDVAPAEGRRHRVRFRFVPTQLSERINLKELWLEYTPDAENP